MKILICAFFILPFSLTSFSQDPLSELTLLISSTEELVSKQKELKSEIIQYIELHDKYLLDMDKKELLLKTSRLAKKILTTIKSETMASLFEPSFISELTLFAKVSSNPVLPKIQ